MLANGRTLQPMGAASSQTRRTQPRAKRRYSKTTQCHELLEGSNTPRWRGHQEGPAVVSQDSPSRSAVAGGCSDSRLLSRPRESSRLGARHRHRFDPILGRAMKGAQQRVHVGSFCPPTREVRLLTTTSRHTGLTRFCLRGSQLAWCNRSASVDDDRRGDHSSPLSNPRGRLLRCVGLAGNRGLQRKDRRGVDVAMRRWGFVLSDLQGFAQRPHSPLSGPVVGAPGGRSSRSPA